MFVYSGTYTWIGGDYSDHELVVLVLPHQHVRPGDPVLMYSQWTTDSRGNKKQKWFDQHIVEKVIRTVDANDTFYFGQGAYRYKAQVSQSYLSVALIITDRDGKLGMSTNAPLNRVYCSTGEASTGSARIWAGTLNWPQYATDEPFMVIVPEGFGAGKPVLAFWQWTVDQRNQTRVQCFRPGSQQSYESLEGLRVFRLPSDYPLACTWEETTEQLSVFMEGAPGQHSQTIELDLAARIEYPQVVPVPATLPKTEETTETTEQTFTVIQPKLHCYVPTRGSDGWRPGVTSYRPW